MKNLLPVMILQCLVVPAVATTVSTVQLPPWNDLSTEQRHAWEQVVTEIYPAASEPRENYRLQRAIVAAHGRNGAASPYPVRRRAELKAASKIAARKILESIDAPSSSTISQWVAERPQFFVSVPRIDLLSIHVRKLDDESTESVRARATQARNALDSGQSFAEVAMQYSNARSAGRGGVVGTIAQGSISPHLESLLFSQEAGSTIGPVEGPGGYHILHVSRVHNPFSLNNSGDYQEAVDAWTNEQVNIRIDQITTEWESATSPTIARTPVHPMHWTSDVWIKHKGKSESFGLGYLAVAENDDQTTEPGEWRAYWKEELASHCREVIAQLALLDWLGISDPALSTALELAMPVAAGNEGLRQWYATLNPSEEQLRAYFDEKGQELFPPQPLYTFLHWDTPITTAPSSKSMEGVHHPESRDAMMQMLNAVYSEVTAAEPPETAADAIKLFDALAHTFSDSRVTSMSKVHAVSPIIDPILFRTTDGQLSRPFDHVNSVGLIFMIEKTTDTATLDRVRSEIELRWRNERLSEHLEQLRNQHP